MFVNYSFSQHVFFKAHLPGLINRIISGKLRNSLFLFVFFSLHSSFTPARAAQMKPGPKIATAEQLKVYTGVNSAEMIADQEARQAFLLWARKVILFFGEGVDGITPDEQVILCEATADYLYSRYTPTRVNYQRGLRPILEEVANRVIRGISSDREKVLALMRYVRDLEPNPERKDLFAGGTEEEIIKKRAWTCNEKARLLIRLYQVAGCPARFVGHHIGGHAVTEVYFQGKWAYLDVRGKYFVHPDGSFATTWEIWNNPSLITSQKGEVYLEMPPGYIIDSTRELYFHPREVIGINNYPISRAGDYDYSWIIDKDWVEKCGYSRIQEDYMKVRASVFGLTTPGN